MRSVPAGSFARIASPAGLWTAWLEHRRGKRRRAAVARFDIDADRAVFALVRALHGGFYRPGPFRQHVVRDPKVRLISAPELRDRLLHQAIVRELAPHYEVGFIDHSYACQVGRGPQRAVLQFLAWTRRYRFRLGLDVRRYFLSIDHERLLALIARRLADARTLALVRMLVSSGGEVYRTRLARQVLGLRDDPVPPGCGLPIGSSLSQWAANLYPGGADHFVKRVLKVRGCLRYMDDLTLFADSAQELEEARLALTTWLREQRRLELKPAAVVPAGEPCTYLGVRVSRGGLGPGEKFRRRMSERLQLAALRGPVAFERSLQAYLGQLVPGGLRRWCTARERVGAREVLVTSLE